MAGYLLAAIFRMAREKVVDEYSRSTKESERGRERERERKK